MSLKTYYFKMEIRAISSAGCDSSVWESIPEEIRLQLSQVSIEAIKNVYHV